MNKQELIKLLVCPKCKGNLDLVESPAACGFACPVCKLVYPVCNDIPVMLENQAVPEAEWLQTGGKAVCES